MSHVGCQQTKVVSNQCWKSDKSFSLDRFPLLIDYAYSMAISKATKHFIPCATIKKIIMLNVNYRKSGHLLKRPLGTLLLALFTIFCNHQFYTVPQNYSSG